MCNEIENNEFVVLNPDANPNCERAEIAFDCAIDALISLRNLEAKKFREMQGWGPLLSASQYAAMNRYVDAVVIVSDEARRVRETRAALYAASSK